MTTLHYLRHHSDLPDPAKADPDGFYYVESDRPRYHWCRTLWVSIGSCWTQYGGPDIYKLMRIARAAYREGRDVTELPDRKPPAIKNGRYVEDTL